MQILPDPGIQTNRFKPRALDPTTLGKVLGDLVSKELITKEDASRMYFTCLSKPKGSSKRKYLGDELEKLGGRELREHAWVRFR